MSGYKFGDEIKYKCGCCGKLVDGIIGMVPEGWIYVNRKIPSDEKNRIVCPDCPRVYTYEKENKCQVE